ncbi:sorting nexin 22 S homeolog [Xenopus laevis]|uniref:MGC68707 protein n=1 Tax=Xenopus laevis TaxID=8355 RepID=Q6PAZ8_XENLA|nr:sorting nexin 22 S homeolog [Xenopus laevis]AAH59986.1 MGC68707 protein [Xenopus laevis]
MIEVCVPSVGHELYKSDKTHTVFRMDVLFNGRRHTLDRRYSEFHALHKLLKKTCKVPDFPPKRVPNWMQKVQEHRRQGLEAYIQGVLWYNTDVPKELLDFLKVRHFHKEIKNCSVGSLDLTAEESSPLSHKAVVGFYKDCYILPPETDILENSVLRGVLQGVYQRQDHKYRPTVNKQPIATTQVLEAQQPQH